ncbi:hypothetical protein MLD38_034085 [Melastoma candidum]|uniref:Uncharacterized protein n=1 Tax=Melastoma candidum TaxID=119954 RepID=A0ACB9MCP3_9MYRT|nr:hypothetical protein MLD38_034085 [Melastoma candidum]
MGQVKGNNQADGAAQGFPYPQDATLLRAPGSRGCSLQKCLTSASVSKQAVKPEFSSCRAARGSTRGTESKRIACDKEKSGTAALVSVINMDPPLPATRRSAEDMDKEDGNLWKRRSGGMMGLKRLELTSNAALPPRQILVFPCLKL